MRLIKKTKGDNPRARRLQRHRRIRARVVGAPERPRLSVFRSLSHIYAQIIDDQSGRTLVAASTLEASLRGKLKGHKTERAKLIGRTLAERARAKGVEAVVFDRGGFLYHGRVSALAEAAREAGLKF